MKVWRLICLFSLGGLVEANTVPSSAVTSAPIHPTVWALAFLLSGLGWSGSTLRSWASALRRRLIETLTGQPQPLPATDPKALAAEIAALNAQIAQLRDTGTAFDMSFDKTLECLDERLRQVEQRTRYAAPPPPSVQVGGNL